MKCVVVASGNPVKARAVELAFSKIFPDQTFDLDCVEVESEVSDQPMSSSEAQQGATNRAMAARAANPAAEYWVGIEGGIEDSAIGMSAFAWIVVMSPDGLGQGRTATFILPQRVAELVREGMELGDADDIYFNPKTEYT